MGFGQTGLHGERFRVAVNRSLRIFLAHVGIAQIIECVRIFGLQREAFFVCSDCLREFLLLLVRACEIEFRLGLVRFQLEAFLQAGDGFVEFILAVQ